MLGLSARHNPYATALTYGQESLSYAELHGRVQRFANDLLALGLARGERVGIYLEKCVECVVACFGAAAAGTVCVPIKPLLKPEQVAYILRDCNVRLLVTSAARHSPLAVTPWQQLAQGNGHSGHRVIDTDMAAILYSSGSTGQPKGVVLLNYRMPRDVLTALEQESITALTAVPPLYIQLAQLEWPGSIDRTLRYFANTGGRLPRETLNALRARVPHAKPFLMYGLTEAFRSTYLPPEEVDRRPDSIGRSIPNAERLVLREDCTACGTDEPGELLHRGALVGLVEDVLYATQLVGECVAFGVEHATLGQVVQVIATPPRRDAPTNREQQLLACRMHLPAYKAPNGIDLVDGPLPRNANGKIDRRLLAEFWNLQHDG